ncbi:MAG: 1-acyl-sn-glycerol-3-phosphate acyltransferase [Bacteroidales bacterium]|nr:1-acyl-sn-glycerol-3-phosphate acyltransferase [Bacteroidales bacterium]MDD2425167.1 1-acyl-sn-glycerol-3-phosphate acyltransferase [Bacteroidales bacterium]MDD3989586.1 1-acyl-sn-glycerol-3-phosphate acyltransferase [Bacteroidales bacterium]MDD4638861.1 1-acyl-sn-glycerol-3-phosphate acyltransferase [Bacteroidales bacterium]
MESQDKVMKVDVEKVLASKNPKLLKIIPKFIIRWLAKLICQREINTILERYSHLKGVNFASSVVEYMGAGYTVEGIEKIDKSKRYIIVSNHPLGGLDGIVLMDLFGKFFDKKIKFVVNDLLMYLEPLKPIFVPVNKYGRQNADIAAQIHSAYESDNQILNFPAGLCSRLVGGEIVDLKWQKNFVSQAIRYNREIIPVYFDGKNSGFFYRIANLRKFLGIKFNYELILLPKEMFRQKKGKFRVIVGNPVDVKTMSAETTPAEICTEIREAVYSLKPKRWNR